MLRSSVSDDSFDMLWTLPENPRTRYFSGLGKKIDVSEFIDGLDASSRILLFSTEGDTDPDMYRRIVWEGAYPSPAER